MNTETKPAIPFVGFPKMGRFSREVVVTEKIDGSNAQIFIGEDGAFLTGSRTRWITPQDDNYGFSRWAHENKDELMKLGPGSHFGEWWGAGIQRKYGLKEKRFSLFNASRWESDSDAKSIPGVLDRTTMQPGPNCVHVVPILAMGPMDSVNDMVAQCMADLIQSGSQAAPGFVDAEGIVIYHTASNTGFKKTLVNDHQPKSLAK